MAQRQDTGSRVGQVVARLKATFSCASGRTDPHSRQPPSRYVLFLQFVILLYKLMIALTPERGKQRRRDQCYCLFWGDRSKLRMIKWPRQAILKFVQLSRDCVAMLFSAELIYLDLDHGKNPKFCSAIFIVMKCPRIFLPSSTLILSSQNSCLEYVRYLLSRISCDFERGQKCWILIG